MQNTTPTSNPKRVPLDDIELTIILRALASYEQRVAGNPTYHLALDHITADQVSILQLKLVKRL